MKPIYLEFCGINSFSEKAEIDFRALLRGGVFGIFGDTGSGKSTILDSIHFALYGEIDRAPKAFNDCINHHSEQAYVSFDFQLTKNGVSHIYRVRRERKRKSGSSKAWLYEISADNKLLALAEGTREVDEKVEEIIGLSFADFKTCIALPQGDFAALVKSTPSERVKLVARLFNLEKYGEKLSRAVNEKYYSAEEEVNLVKAKMGENEGGNREAIEELQTQIFQEKTRLTEAKKAVAKAEENYLNALSLQREKTQFDELCARLEKLSAQKTQAEETRALLEKLPKANTVAQKANALKKAREDKQNAKTNLAQALQGQKDALESLEQAKKTLVEGGFEEGILEATVRLQKVLSAQDDIETERKTKAELDACISAYQLLKKQTQEEDFVGEKAKIEQELASLGEDDSLLSYLKRNYKHLLLGETYGEFRVDLRGLAKKYPQTEEDVQTLLKKYTFEGETGVEIDVASVNLAFKQQEMKRKELKEKLQGLEKRQRAFEENQSKKALLAEQGKILRKNYELAVEKTAQIKTLGTKEQLSEQIEKLKKQQLTVQSQIEKAQEKVNEYYAEAQKQQGLFIFHENTEKNLETELIGALQESGFSSKEEAFALIEKLGDFERTARENKAFFDEYGSYQKQYEQVDKNKFKNFNDERLSLATAQKREAQETQEILLQTLATQETRLKNLLALKEKYEELGKELIEKENKKNICDELRSLLKSNRFLEFIASEYLQEICVSASKTLLSLTNGRYFLEYDKEFKVGDNLDGGNLRGVKTLSGGETFLVSLSLALSLSAAICLKSLRPIEFFFLDEGFGTLDEKLVETVMDVLGKLSKNFAVGLISHVEELKRRIDNKILVTGANEQHGSHARVECF